MPVLRSLASSKIHCVNSTAKGEIAYARYVYAHTHKDDSAIRAPVVNFWATRSHTLRAEAEDEFRQMCLEFPQFGYDVLSKFLFFLGICVYRALEANWFSQRACWMRNSSARRTTRCTPRHTHTHHLPAPGNATAGSRSGESFLIGALTLQITTYMYTRDALWARARVGVGLDRSFEGMGLDFAISTTFVY